MASVATRLSAFALVLAGSFGTAYTVGEALPGHSHTGSTDGDDTGHDTGHDTGDSHIGGHSSGETGLRVPTSSMDGYELITEATDPERARFHLIGPDGARIVEYDPVEESIQYITLARPDLSEIQRLRPPFDAGGSFVVPLPSPGRWHIVVEVIPAGRAEPVVVSTFVGTDTVAQQRPLPPAADEVVVSSAAGDLTVSRAGLIFKVGGGTGSITDAHLVVFRAADLASLHLHPSVDAAGVFVFEATLPPAGTYRLLLQFTHDDELVSVGFTVPAEETV